MEANMDDRSVYERAVLSTIERIARGEPGISDADRNGEYAAMKVFYPALEAFRTAIRFCAENSDLRGDMFRDILQSLEDNAPDQAIWDEAISDARRNY